MEFNGERRDVDVEEPLIRPIGRGTGPKRGWAKLEASAMSFGSVASVDVVEVVFAVLTVREDFARATLANREFSDGVFLQGALNFDGGKDKIAWFAEFQGAR